MASDPTFRLEGAVDPETVKSCFLDGDYSVEGAISSLRLLAQRLQARQQCRHVAAGDRVTGHLFAAR